MPIAKNAEGQYLFLDQQSGQWQPAQTAVNPQTGARLVFDGRDWSEAGNEFADRAATMTPQDISVARAKNDAFGDFLRQQAMQPREGESEAERNRRLYGGAPVPIGEGALRSFGQGITFGGMDEITAAAAAAADPLFRGSGGTFGERYDAYLNRERQRLNQFREEQPIVATAAEVAGAIPTSLVAAPTNVPVTMGGRMLQSGVVAGAQGAAYGGLSGEGGAAERGMNALQTGAIAAPLGAVAEPVAAGIGAGARRFLQNRALAGARDAIPPELDGLRASEVDVLTRPFATDPRAAAAARGAMRDMPPEGMLADMSPAYDDALDFAIQSSGPGGALAKEAVENRSAAAAKALDDAFENTLGPLQGPTQGVRAQARSIAQMSAPERQAAYQAAYNQPIDYASDQGRAIEGVLGRIAPDDMQAAIAEANKDMLADGMRNQQIMARVADDGTITFVEMPNVQQLDYIKRALDALGKSNVDKFGRVTTAGLRSRRLAKDLRNALSDAVPEYGNALRVASDKIGVDNAIELGQNVLRPNMTREMVAEMTEGMTDAERVQAALSLRQYIDDEAAKVMAAESDQNLDVREAAKIFKTLSSRANREKLEMLLGSRGAREIFDALDRVGRAVEQRAAVAAGSGTARRKFIKERMTAMNAQGPMDALATGQPITAAQRLVAQLTGNTPGAQLRANDIAGERLVRMLTQGGTQNIDAILRAVAERGPRALQTAESTQALARVLLRSPSAVTAATAETPRAALGLTTP